MLNHPNIHLPWSQWSEDQTLHVAVPYSNYFRWRTRRETADICRRHLLASPNVRPYFGEVAYGARPWELSPEADLQLRTGHELFHKENISKLIIRTFPPDWKYGMICDADFHFTRHDWALETIHQLQHYSFVQPYSSYIDTSGATYGTAQLPTRANTSFFFNYIQNGFRVSPQYFNGQVDTRTGKKVQAPFSDYGGHAMGISEKGEWLRGTGATGGALAFTRAAYDAVGGLMDKCILGHGDWYMAFGLVDVEPPDIHVRGYSQDYLEYIRAWRRRARVLGKNVGYVDGMAVHAFHGSKTRRAYSSRDLILAKHKFSVTEDIYEDWQGLYQLTPNKPALRDDIRKYFVSRSEDDPNLGSEKLMV